MGQMTHYHSCQSLLLLNLNHLFQMHSLYLCKREDVTKRYWHLSQGRNQPLFYTFVKNAYAFKDDDCSTWSFRPKVKWHLVKSEPDESILHLCIFFFICTLENYNFIDIFVINI
jgi:hypothetical protein